MMGGGGGGWGHGHGGGHGGMRRTMLGGGAGRLGDWIEDEELGSAYDHRVVHRLFSYIGPYKPLAIMALVGIVIYTLSVVAVPYLVREGIDAIVAKDSNRVTGIAVIVVLVSLVGWLAQWSHLNLMARVSQGVLYTLRVQMFRHLHRLSLSFYDRNEVGRIMSRVQSDVLNLQEFLGGGVMGFAEILGLGFIMIALFLIDPKLAAITLAVAPVLVFGLIIWQGRARSAFIRVRQAIAQVNADLQENISGVRVIQSLNRQAINTGRFDNFNTDHLNANLRAGRLSAVVLPMVELLMAVAIALIVIMGGRWVLGGSLEISVLVAFALYIQRFFDPIRVLTMQYTELQRSMASGARIFELLDTQPEIADKDDAIELPRLSGEIRFNNVSHNYTPDVEVLHNIDLEIRPGETVALVGETGAGKSTIVSLLARFYEATTGSVTIDGYDVKTVTIPSLTRQVSMVLQEPFLFSASVRDNIRYGRLDASNEDVESAAKTVGAHDFIMSLQDGYDTLLHERGGNLSIGQRQLVSFARALIADPRILILDEATASIDTHTEIVIQEALRKILRGRTSVVIAHRLSTIRSADRIIALENGRIVESGTHEDLLLLQGLYHRLYTMNYQLDTTD